MSYHTWTVDGFGVCVDDIKTTPEKLLHLASMVPSVLEEVRYYLRDYFNGDYKDEDLTLDDFDDLEGDYCERGVTYVLFGVLSEVLTVDYADDYNGTPYILYTPTYPWRMSAADVRLTKEDVEDIFRKYVSILTDEPITIEYYSVENGG